MLQVSQRAHYGLRAMTELAKAYGHGSRSLVEIAQVEHLPVGYLEQLAGVLRRAGLIEGTRGAHGGYQLARDPSTVSIGDVLRALEGSVAPVECLSDEYITGNCVRDSDCLSQFVWQRIKVGVDTLLDSMTLADVTHLGDGASTLDVLPIVAPGKGPVADTCFVPR